MDPNSFRVSLLTGFSRRRIRTLFEYQQLQGITVKPGGLFSTPAVRLIPCQGKRIKLCGKRKALMQLASSVPLLKGSGAPLSLL